jgi:hypothetical protein
MKVESEEFSSSKLLYSSLIGFGGRFYLDCVNPEYSSLPLIW